MTGRFIGLKTGNHKAAAARHHAAFRRCVGSEQIASPFAIQVLMAALAAEHPRAALEVGSGIGTMTALLADACACVSIIEDSLWCQQAMLRNLAPGQMKKVTARVGHWFDLAVVDGHQQSAALVRDAMQHHTLLLVEGNRRAWRAGLAAGRSRVAVNLRPFDRSKGMWVIRFDPTIEDRMAFALERGWQHVLGFAARVWSFLTGATIYHGKKRRLAAREA